MSISQFEARARQAEERLAKLTARIESLEKNRPSGVSIDQEPTGKTYLEFPSVQDAFDFVTKNEKWWLFGKTWQAVIEGNKIAVKYYEPLSEEEFEAFMKSKNSVPDRTVRFDQFYAKQMEMFGETKVTILNEGEKAKVPSIKKEKTTEEKKEKPMSKSEAKKLAKEQAKQQRKEAAAAEEVKYDDKVLTEIYGNLPIIQSTSKTDRVFHKVQEIEEGQQVLLRGRLHTSRAQGKKLCFIILRQNFYTIQAVIVQSETIPEDMLAWAKKIPKESLIEIHGTVSRTNEKIEGTTQKDHEINVTKLFVIVKSEPLKIQIEDCARPKSVLQAQAEEVAAIEKEIEQVNEQLKKNKTPELKAQLEQLKLKKSKAQKYSKVSRDTRLNNRVLDLRTPANQGIFRIQSGVCQLFREFLLKNGFVEIHTPKILGCASEGGAEVFKLKYFDSWAFLAQSPQLYKQMAIASDLPRVFETGPVFRAENSFTHRHLTEFTGLDLEMQFQEHYHEVLDLIDALFISIFDGLNERFKDCLEAVAHQFPFEPLKYKYPSLRLNYSEAVKLLNEAGIEIEETEDLGTEREKKLGAIVREKYDTDFYIIDKFPIDIRPFYTMPDPKDPRWGNSYDIFLRGEEIMSGAQRIHIPDLLEQRAKLKGVPIEGIKDYVNSFKYGAMPHAGGGIGLERVVMLFLGLKNIRSTSMFPRDPHRTMP